MKRIKDLPFKPLDSELNHRDTPPEVLSVSGTTWMDFLKSRRPAPRWLEVLDQSPNSALSRIARESPYKPLIVSQGTLDQYYGVPLLLTMDEDRETSRMSVCPCYQCVTDKGILRVRSAPRLCEVHFEIITEGHTETPQHLVQWVCESCGFSASPSMVPKDPRGVHLKYWEMMENGRAFTKKKKDVNKKARDQYG